jgi:hypothetical protein
VTVQDLRPNSQDISAFYLGNIYGVLADPNVTRPSIPSPVAKPPPFSPPRYAVWVNSLWFLSLVMSLSCAFWATSLHQWARRYIRVTQPARCSPEKRARMRAFFAKGVDKMHMPWAVEGLPALLHLSLFLFFGGLDQEVFLCVVSWIGFFSMVYGLITLLPFIRQESPYYTPLSISAWFSYAGIRYVTFKVLASITYRYGSFATWNRCCDLMELYHGWMLGGVEKKAEEMASERSSKIDMDILGWTISALGDDHSLETFIDAIPGFFDSKLVKDLREYLPHNLSRRLSDALDGFLDRTLTSNSVIDSVKLRRLEITLSAMDLIHFSRLRVILADILLNYRDQVPKTIEIWHTLAPWCTSNDQDTSRYAQGIVAKVLWAVRERDDRWVELSAHVYGLPERVLRDILTHDHDSGSLAILIHLTRKALRSNLHWDVLEAFTQIDMRNTLSGLQHDFCTLWNEIVQEAEKQRPYSTPVRILREIRHHYIALHQGTDASPTAFSPSTDDHNEILWRPSSYPLCDIASHRPDSIAHVPLPLLADSPDSPHHHHSISGGTTVLRQVKEASTIARPSPSHPTKPSEIRDSFQAATATPPALPVRTSPHITDASPPAALATALPGNPLAATMPHPLEGTMQRDIVIPGAEPDILSTRSIRGPTRSTPPVLNKSLKSSEEGIASASNPLLPSSPIVGFSIPTSPPPSRVPPLPNAESRTLLLSTTTPSPSTGNATLPHLRACRLVNTGSMCFSNAVLQLLVHSPPFWDLFRKLGDLKGPRRAGVPETSDDATPLVDATLRFYDEFRFKEKGPWNDPPPPQQVSGGTPREDEDVTKKSNAVDSFDPIYMYDAMKEKRQFKSFLVRSASWLLLLICADLMYIGRPTAGCRRVFPPLPRRA